jgi:hypothetical protein
MERNVPIVLLSVLVAACGDTSVPISETGYADGCSPGGIWRATDGAFAVIDESHRGHLVQPDGIQFAGDLVGVTFDQGKLCLLDREKSVLHAVLPMGWALPDGSLEAQGKVDANWKRRADHMQMDADLRTSAGGTLSLAFQGAYDGLHGVTSSRSAVSGSYRPISDRDSEVLTVDSAGTAFGQNARTGCVASGNVDPVDTRFNVYRVRLTFSNCQGERAVLNGWPAKGLGFLDQSQTPAELLLAIDVVASTQHYSVVATMERL